MLQNLFNKMELLAQSPTHNASYIHPSRDSIPELWRTFPNRSAHEIVNSIKLAHVKRFRAC